MNLIIKSDVIWTSEYLIKFFDYNSYILNFTFFTFKIILYFSFYFNFHMQLSTGFTSYFNLQHAHSPLSFKISFIILKLINLLFLFMEKIDILNVKNMVKPEETINKNLCLIYMYISLYKQYMK